MSKNNNSPNRQIIFDDTDIAIYHLIFLGNLIENTISSFTNIIGKIDDTDEKSLYVSTNSMIIVQTISFLDEFDTFITSIDPDLDTTIKAIKKTVKPALKQIREWKDLREFRNNILAHNLRNKKNTISIFTRGMSSYDIPQTGADFAVLVSCISMVKKVFESAFGSKLKEIQAKIDQQHYPRKERRFTNSKEVEAVITTISEKVNANIIELKLEIGV